MSESFLSDPLGGERRVLAFLGRFASVQSSIDTALEYHFNKTMPALGPLVIKQYLSRIRDEDRIPFFLALAKEIDYQRDLSSLARIYTRAKETRDLIGHSPGVAVAWTNDGWQVAVTRNHDYNPKRLSRVPHPLWPETFDRLVNDCKWMESHAWRLIYEARLTTFVAFTGNAGDPFAPTEPPIPTDLPVDGEPLP